MSEPVSDGGFQHLRSLLAWHQTEPEDATMSESIQILIQIIESAQSGKVGAVKLLRKICVSAAKAAPAYDLIAIGQCLVHLGNEATKRQAEQN